MRRSTAASCVSKKMLLQATADLSKGRRQFSAKDRHGTDDHDSNKRSDEAIFDGRGAGFIGSEAIDVGLNYDKSLYTHYDQIHALYIAPPGPLRRDVDLPPSA